MTTDSPDALAAILRGVEQGVFPAPDFSVTVVPPPSERDSCVLGFTAHIVVAADVEPSWVYRRLRPGDLSAPLNPPFLHALESLTGRRVSAIDVLLLAPALPDDAVAAELDELTDRDHPRVRRALRHRDDVHVYGHPSGAVLLTGRGLGGRLECAMEVPPDHRGQGLGRRLARAARALVPAGSHLWAQVSPGNAASLRAFLAAGFTPVGSEALLVRR